VLVEPAGAVTRAWLAEPLSGNPTGAGDAAVAALAAGLSLGRAPRDTLRDAVAWSAAAVLHPVAGHIRPADIDRLLPMVRVQPGQPASPRATSQATSQAAPRPSLPEEASHADPPT
jgi:tagatose 6-phosphate kinase